MSAPEDHYDVEVNNYPDSEFKKLKEENKIMREALEEISKGLIGPPDGWELAKDALEKCSPIKTTSEEA